MSEPDEDGMMTLIPAGTDYVHTGKSVTLIFPTEDDAIIFVELMQSLMRGEVSL